MDQLGQEGDQYEDARGILQTNFVSSPTTTFQQPKHDINVIATADDAVLSKLYTSQCGYYEDPFLEHFAKNAKGLTVSTSLTNKNNMGLSTRMASSPLGSSPIHLPSSNIRPSPFGTTMTRSEGGSARHHGQPIIRRGTYARVCCLDKAIAAFLSCSQRGMNREKNRAENFKDDATKVRQIVVLGAGKDTTYFRYKNKLLTTPVYNDPTKTSLKLRWYDVDFDSVMSNKQRLIKSLPQDLHQRKDNESYYTIGFDLRQPPIQLINVLVEKHNFTLDVPTLFLLECVQMYMVEQDSRTLLQQIAKSCCYPLVILYDPILLGDSFGKVMAENLTRAGVLPVPSPVDSTLTEVENSDFSCGDDNMRPALMVTQTLQKQLTKMKECGFDSVIGCNMTDAYDTILTQGQRSHANRCEMLDELEEWYLLMNHYCLVVACGGGSSAGSSNNEPNTQQQQHDVDWIDLRNRFLQVQEKQKLIFPLPNSQNKNEATESVTLMGFVRGKCLTKGLAFKENSS